MVCEMPLHGEADHVAWNTFVFEKLLEFDGLVDLWCDILETAWCIMHVWEGVRLLEAGEDDLVDSSSTF